jgi:hypothetical protein
LENKYRILPIEALGASASADEASTVLYVKKAAFSFLKHQNIFIFKEVMIR